jgi:bifunctional non-homologous end joining protein LigD
MAMPRAIEVARPALVAVPPRGDWLHEVKIDGYRMLAERVGDRIELTTRNGNPWTLRAPHVVAALQAFGPQDFVLDGEMTLVLSDGSCDFHGLRSPSRSPAQLTYVVFDVLFLEGRDLRSDPLRARRAQLEQLVPERGSLVQRSLVYTGDGTELLRRVIALGLEGIVSKRAGAGYPAGPTREWQKTKNKQYVRR